MVDYRRTQKIFLSVMGLFLLFLAGMIVYRSSVRKGLLLGDQVDSLRGGLREVVKAESALHIQEFSRTQTRDGKTVWAVKARDASYYPQSDLAHVNDAEITLYRKEGAPCVIRSSAGKLFLAGEQLKRADFEGDVKFATTDASIAVDTNFASYDADTNLVHIPGPVKISGPGYVLNAVGMSMSVDNQVVDLLSQVQSEFKPSARVPSISPTGSSPGSSLANGAMPKAAGETKRDVKAVRNPVKAVQPKTKRSANSSAKQRKKTVKSVTK